MFFFGRKFKQNFVFLSSNLFLKMLTKYKILLNNFHENIGSIVMTQETCLHAKDRLFLVICNDRETRLYNNHILL